MAKTKLLKLKKGVAVHITAKYAPKDGGKHNVYRVVLVGRKYKTTREDGTATKVNGYTYQMVAPKEMKVSPVLPASNNHIQQLLNADRVQILENYVPQTRTAKTYPHYRNHDWFKAIKTGKVDAAFFTANCAVSPRGNAVLGAGLAKEVQETFMKLGINTKQVLGKKYQTYHINRKDAAANKHMKTRFNIVASKVTHVIELNMKDKQTNIYSFPVKDGFWQHASVSMITRSCEQAVKIANEKGYKVCILNFPGIGNGKLSGRYKELVDMMNKVLDERFTVLQKPTAKEGK